MLEIRDIKFRYRLRNKIDNEHIIVCVPLYSDSHGLMQFPIDLKVWEVLSIDEFTGIYDCKKTIHYPNGQPIYENDILTCPTIENYEPCLVKFGKHNDAYNGWYVQWSNLQGELNGSWSDVGEVIGDIYFNSDLLNN